MKKIILLSSIFLMFGATMQAQGTRYGFKFGLASTSISDFSFDLVNVEGETPIASPGDNEDGRIAVTTGFFAEIPITEKLKFQPEFLFTSLGNKGDAFKYEQLQLPLALKYDFSKLYVLAGPQAAIKVSFFEQSNDYKSIDFSAFGGIGYFFGENIFVEARYTLGFAEVFEDDADIPIRVQLEGSNEVNQDNRYRNLSGKNAYFSFVLGYRL
ncbi:PorT family protein [Dokdonia sinensis]|uniref:PorT family protein n=1 Tax=Dokdonia sinensis TaxID=2479847 RepID=A0A3M0GJV1_9FLAO|nr:porin family protein [Dokdonia sinensis]RMB57586.1 PorT family protein [Dokdonia sinensis]